MYRYHHISFRKQVVRAICGLFLSVGYARFWIGLYNGSILLSVAGGNVILIGLVVIVKLWIRISSYMKSRNDRQMYLGD